MFKGHCWKKTFSEKHFSVEACQLMVCHHRPSSFVFIGLVHNSMLFCKYKMCTSFMQRPQTGHFCCKHWHKATERFNEKCQIHSHLEFHQKEIALDMLQFTPRGNFPLVKNPWTKWTISILTLTASCLTNHTKFCFLCQLWQVTNCDILWHFGDVLQSNIIFLWYLLF